MLGRSSRTQSLGCFLVLIAGLYGGVLLAQSPVSRPVHYTFTGQFIFWIGALALVLFIGRFMFKEQLNERRTLRRLIREIGPFYPEFDIDRLKHWVNLCAPHVWVGWETGDWSAIDDFVTDEFKTGSQSFLSELSDAGHELECQLMTVLKVHPLGLYMVDEGPAPKGTELMLRLEQKAIYCVRNSSGKIVTGRKGFDQIQHFWTLRHDGTKLRLHQVWLAEDDATDLAERPIPPVVTEWVRGSTSNQESES